MYQALRQPREKYLLASQHLFISVSASSPLWLTSFLTPLQKNDKSSSRGLSPCVLYLREEGLSESSLPMQTSPKDWVWLTGGGSTCLAYLWLQPKLLIIVTTIKQILCPLTSFTKSSCVPLPSIYSPF